MIASSESASTDQSRRVDELAARVEELDARLRTAEIATGDEKTAKELRKAVEAISRHDPRLEERLTNRVEVIADRLNTMAATVSTTAAALAGKDGEIVGLRRELERGRALTEALSTEIRNVPGTAEIAELRRAVAALGTVRPGETENKRVERLSGKVDFLAERVDTLATTVASTAAGLAGREGDVSALRRRIDEDVGQLARALDDLGHTRAEDELASQIRSLSGAVAKTAHDLARRHRETAELRALVEDGHARLAAALAEIRPALGAAVGRIDGLEKSVGGDILRSVEQDVATTAARIDDLTARLDGLGLAVEAMAEAHADKEQEIVSLGRRFEHASASVDELVRDLSEAIATMPSAAGDSPALTADLADIEGRVAELSERLTSISRDRGAAAAELAQTTAFWSAELSSIEERFDELGARIDSLEQGAAAGTPAAPTAGGGRFRLELRNLELRLDHAEAAARENREAVLTQLERLASRVDSRLEAAALSDENASSLEAQVVPIRATDL